MRPRSLGARLMLAALAGVLAMAILAVLALWRPTPVDSTMMAAELTASAASIAEALQLDAAGQPVVRLQRHRDDIYATMTQDAAYRVLDAEGRSVASSGEGPLLASLQAMPLAVREFSMSGAQGSLTLWTSVRRRALGGHDYTIQVAHSDRLLRTLDRYQDLLYLRAGLVSGLCALGVFWVIVYLTIRHMLRPLHRVSAAAARIEPRNLAARLRTDGLPQEIRPLVDAFNAALTRLEAGYRVQQEFLAAAAHELKTPLALLRAEIELGGASNREMLLRDTDLMARLVHQLLHLAEVSEAQNFRYGAVQPGRVVAEVIDYLARLAEHQKVQLLLLRDDADGTIQADAGALFVLLKNLLENALHHSPAGTVVTVLLHPEGLDVIDQGSGIAEADRELLFQRFRRGAAAFGSGAGLGLAICLEIAIAHGWSLAAAARAPGTGAVFQLRYTAAAPAELRHACVPGSRYV
jgi:signal transduction histidine kinase